MKRAFLLAILVALFMRVHADTNDSVRVELGPLQTNDERSRTIQTRSVFRGNSLIIREHLIDGQVGTREFYSGGKLLFSESDRNSEGLFEMIILQNQKKDESDVVRRNSDGSVQPISGDELRAMRQKRQKTISEIEDAIERHFGKGAPTKDSSRTGDSPDARDNR